MAKTLEELKSILDSFTPAKIEFVARVVESLANPPNAEIQSSNTWLTTSANWIEYFSLALSVHHGATTEPLGLNSFETVFRNACAHMNWIVDPPGSKTQRFVDLSVQTGSSPQKRLSLKSTAAKNLSKSTVHISKLTEAAWIQDERTAKGRRSRTLETFQMYQDAVTDIVILRAFRQPEEIPGLYQLIEIPSSIFDSIQHEPLESFRNDAPVIECRVGDEVVALVSMDRSDAKITIKQIQLSACTIHAEWRGQE